MRHDTTFPGGGENGSPELSSCQRTRPRLIAEPSFILTHDPASVKENPPADRNPCPTPQNGEGASTARTPHSARPRTRLPPISHLFSKTSAQALIPDLFGQDPMQRVAVPMVVKDTDDAIDQMIAFIRRSASRRKLRRVDDPSNSLLVLSDGITDRAILRAHRHEVVGPV